jgi:hypothetical protein
MPTGLPIIGQHNLVWCRESDLEPRGALPERRQAPNVRGDDYAGSPARGHAQPALVGKWSPASCNEFAPGIQLKLPKSPITLQTSSAGLSIVTCARAPVMLNLQRFESPRQDGPRTTAAASGCSGHPPQPTAEIGKAAGQALDVAHGVSMTRRSHGAWLVAEAGIVASVGMATRMAVAIHLVRREVSVSPTSNPPRMGHGPGRRGQSVVPSPPILETSCPDEDTKSERSLAPLADGLVRA